MLHPGVLVSLFLVGALIVYGLRGWERMARRRRELLPGTT